MKKRMSLLVFVLLATSFSVINSYQANAGECSATDPCDNWAVVNNEGIVTTVIVCQESVCGSNGLWAGTLDGNRLVPQVAADPITHMATGSVATEVNNNVVVRENNGSYTIDYNTPVETSFVENNVDSQTTYSTSVSSSRYGFSYQDTVGIGQIEPTVVSELAPSENTTATLSARTRFADRLDVEEREIFLNRATADEVRQRIITREYNTILARIEILIQRLSKWIK